MLTPARLVFAFSLLALLAASPAGARRGPAELPAVDSRAGARLPSFSSAARAAQAHLKRDVGQQAGNGRVDATRSGVAITGIGDTVAGPSSADPERVALGYLRDNATALGLRAGDVGALRLTRRYTDWGGTTHLVWTQSAGGIDAYDNEVRANVAKDGSLINVGSTALPGFGGDGKPSLDASKALGIASRDVAALGAAPRAGASTGPQERTRFSNGAAARLALFGEPGGARLAWEVTVAGESPNVYDVIVDADNGHVLARVGKTEYANDATVYDRSPSAGAAHTVDLAPWLTDPSAPARLEGPNAIAWSDLNGSCTPIGCTGPDAGEDTPPSSGGNFVYPIVPFPLGSAQNCPAVTPFCTWNPADTTSIEKNRLQNATQIFYYVNKFHDHLKDPPIGFTAESGNFEGADRVVVNTDDNFTNGSRNNANMFTPPDGTSGVLQTYLFTKTVGLPSYAAVNSGDDAVIVYHEYTHGLSHRLISSSGLDQLQSGAMGEGWSDWYAFDYAVNQGSFTDTPAPGELDPDDYVSHGSHVIRTQAIDCPVGASASQCPGHGGAGAGGYTYGDFGKIRPGPQVHSDGEIWGETLWDLRTALGSDVAERIVTDGMRLSPNSNPSFLQERDAILAADDAAFAGAHRDAIWQVFAARGMGAKASTSGSASASPTEDFSVPGLVVHQSLAVADPVPGGDGDGRAEPGETVNLTETVFNSGPQVLSAVSGLLDSSQDGVVVDNDTQSFSPSSLANGGSGANASAYAVTVPSGATCGTGLPLTLHVTTNRGQVALPVTMPIGGPSRVSNTATAIPDGPSPGVDSTIAVSGLGRITDLDVSLDIKHTYDADLEITLRSPSGTTVSLVNRRGDAGDDFTSTVLDDEAATAISAGVAPFSGSFKPEQPLSAVDGQDANGTWTLHIRDAAGTDTGTLSSWAVGPPECSTTVAALPSADTAAAGGVTADAATLNGTVDPRGTTTSFRFQYGATTSYGQRTPVDEAGAGSGGMPLTQGIGRLTPDQMYHYRLLGLRNGVVVARGGDQSFTTAAPPATAAPGGGEGPPGLAGPQPAGFSFAKGRKTLTLDSKGQFTWSFGAHAGLRGTAVFESAGKVTQAARKKKVLKLGRKAFTVDSKGIAKVKLKLSSASLQTVKKLKSLRVKATLTAATGEKATATFTLAAPQKK